MTLGEKINILRSENNISEEQLAEKLGVTVQSVFDWESGAASPDAEKLAALSELFSISADALVKDGVDIIYKNDGFEDVSSYSPEADELSDTAEIAVAPSLGEEENLPVRESDILPESDSPDGKKKRRGSSQAKKIIISLVVCVALIAAITVPYFTGGYDRLAAKIQGGTNYPYVLVHGMGGWGSGSKINEIAPYWGADSGSLSEYLNGQGYKVYEANVGPFSSCWDRACELYAELTGTQVDYGEAHSKKHSHERYGRTYSKPLVPDWGKKDENGKIIKINLVGHSFGGNTVRLFTNLLVYGAQEEIAATGDKTSAFFKGTKTPLVNSVTTLCSPHNGSTLYYIAKDYGLTSTALKLCFSIAGLSEDTGFQKFYDFHLEQFGLKDKGTSTANLQKVSDIIDNSTDNAIYDLSPEGAQAINNYIAPINNIYYFSYSFCTTQKSSVSTAQVPISATLPVLKATALLMGNYSVNKQTDFKIDETWLPNDGLVNVVSARYPAGVRYTEFNEKKIRAGIWNVMPTAVGDHGTAIGMNRSAELTHGFYTDMIEMINALPTHGRG